jgi:hypothetical protein
MPPNSTVALEAHAQASLRYIRASMQAATSVPVPGAAAVTLGVIGLAAAGIAATTPDLSDRWLLVWLAAAVAAAASGSLIMARQYRSRGLPLLVAPVRNLLLSLLPGLFAGATVSAVEFASGDRHAIPGTWLLLYGCALMSASAPTAASVGWLGVAFTGCGLAAFVLPDALQNLSLAIGFGVLQVLFGLYIGTSSHERAR